jgi:hypothetical protein
VKHLERGWYVIARYRRQPWVHLLAGPFATQGEAKALVKSSTKNPARYSLRAEFVTLKKIREWEEGELVRDFFQTGNELKIAEEDRRHDAPRMGRGEVSDAA